MSNRWGIPIEIEEVVKKRDIKCVYCGIELTGADNIALCCWSCNASKGRKKLED
jgi:hypothetical protein